MSKEDKTLTIEIKADDDWRKVGTVQGVAREIMSMDTSAEDYEFRLQAKLKRLVHHEKHSVYNRLSRYAKDGMTKYFAELAIGTKAETHKEMSKLPDEKIITWNVGPHKYGK